MAPGKADSEPPAVSAEDQSISEPAGGTDEATVPEETDAPPVETEATPSGRPLDVFFFFTNSYT